MSITTPPAYVPTDMRPIDTRHGRGQGHTPTMASGTCACGGIVWATTTHVGGRTFQPVLKCEHCGVLVRYPAFERRYDDD